MIKLAYPNIAAPTTLITLPDVEKLPLSRPVRLKQSAIETDGGELVVMDFGKKVSVFTVSLYPLSKANADAIMDFFQNPTGSGGVNGRVAAWQFQDSSTTIHDVRFSQDVMETQQVTPATWRVMLTLRQVI
jgi:hypothetical protein